MTAVAKRSSWKDAYDAQMAIWRWERTDGGRHWLAGSYRIGVEDLRPSVHRLLATIYGSEESRILSAEPIYVSEGMCDVVEAAAETFQPEALYPTDLLVPSGFVYYARPFPVLDRFDTPTSIAAVSWSPMLAVGREDAEDLGVLPDFATPEELSAWLEGRETTLDGIALTIYAETKYEEWATELGPAPPLVPMHLTPWWFGMTFDGNETDENGKPTGAAWWWTIVQTTFRLSQQQLAARHPERPDRPQRRAAARLGWRDRDVVVVRLRREKNDRESDREPEPANYSHRFIVSGHWRNQWYPASKVHRQIWISPYVKGPEEAPLVVRPRRAFTWDR